MEGTLVLCWDLPCQYNLSNFSNQSRLNQFKTCRDPLNWDNAKLDLQLIKPKTNASNIKSSKNVSNTVYIFILIVRLVFYIISCNKRDNNRFLAQIIVET